MTPWMEGAEISSQSVCGWNLAPMCFAISAQRNAVRRSGSRRHAGWKILAYLSNPTGTKEPTLYAECGARRSKLCMTSSTRHTETEVSWRISENSQRTRKGQDKARNSQSQNYRCKAPTECGSPVLQGATAVKPMYGPLLEVGIRFVGNGLCRPECVDTVYKCFPDNRSP